MQQPLGPRGQLVTDSRQPDRAVTNMALRFEQTSQERRLHRGGRGGNQIGNPDLMRRGRPQPVDLEEPNDTCRTGAHRRRRMDLGVVGTREDVDVTEKRLSDVAVAAQQLRVVVTRLRRDEVGAVVSGDRSVTHQPAQPQRHGLVEHRGEIPPALVAVAVGRMPQGLRMHQKLRCAGVNAAHVEQHRITGSQLPGLVPPLTAGVTRPEAMLSGAENLLTRGRRDPDEWPNAVVVAGQHPAQTGTGRDERAHFDRADGSDSGAGDDRRLFVKTLDGPGRGVGASHEAHWARGGAATTQAFLGRADAGEVDPRPRTSLEDGPFLDVPVEDGAHRVVDRQDETVVDPDVAAQVLTALRLNVIDIHLTDGLNPLDLHQFDGTDTDLIVIP